MLEVRLLGSFQIKCGKKTVEIASRPAQSLFAYLILNAGTSYRREKLAGQLWPDSTEESARDYLRHALWRIRKALQEAGCAACLKADDRTISFDATQRYWLDATELLRLNDHSSLDEIAEALGLYEGELLPGFYDEWVSLERDRLQSAYETHINRLLDSLQAENRWADMVRWAEQWIALGNKPEAAFRHLMHAYAAQGDMAKAAAAYERCVRALAEHGVEPSEQTTRLLADLKGRKAVAASMQESPHPSAPIPPATSADLPVQLTSFIGRKKELKEIAALLAGSRLVSLIGTGGVGKTRLAIQCAEQARPRFKDGVFWVDLVGLADGTLIPEQIAQTLHIPETSQEHVIDAVLRTLKSKHALIVFDNCEHIIQDSTAYAEQLLAACPHVAILATSRERLGVFYETAWHVPSLSDDSSLALFAERARAARHDFVLTESNHAVVQRICRLLDNIPLAIELAAARLNMLSVDEIVQHLDRRFDLLTGGSRTTLSRQQTLRSAIDWSHDLLTPPERMLFRRLAIFAGSFALQAAEEVCAGNGLDKNAVLGLLARLLDKSLVMTEASAAPGPTRYRLLETIRQYALEKLENAKEISAIRSRHLEYFVRLAEESETYLNGPAQADWIDRLEYEVDNIRSALAAQANTLELRLRLAGSLAMFWDRNHYQEGFQRLDGLLAESKEPTIGRARALYAKGFLCWSSPNVTHARPYLEELARIADSLEASALASLADRYLGAVAIASGQYEAAQRYLQQSVTIGQQLENDPDNSVSAGLSFLADIPLVQGRDDEARALYEKAAVIARQCNDINSLTYCSRRLGYLALEQKEYQKAYELFAESLGWNQQIRHFVGINRCVAAFASLRAAQGRTEEAIQLSAAVEGFLQATSSTLFPWDADVYYASLSRLQTAAPQRTFDENWRRGLQMGLEEAVQYALKEKY